MNRFLALLILVPGLAFGQGLVSTGGSSVVKAGGSGSVGAAWMGLAGNAAYPGLWLGNQTPARLSSDFTLLRVGSSSYVAGAGLLFLRPSGSAADQIKLASGYVIILGGSGFNFESACDSTASPGAATCNQGAGRAAIALGASNVVITNSMVTATSIILANLQTVDTTCVSIKAVTPAAGSFTVTTNGGNCAAATNIGWMIASR